MFVLLYREGHCSCAEDARQKDVGICHDYSSCQGFSWDGIQAGATAAGADQEARATQQTCARCLKVLHPFAGHLLFNASAIDVMFMHRCIPILALQSSVCPMAVTAELPHLLLYCHHSADTEQLCWHLECFAHPKAPMQSIDSPLLVSKIDGCDAAT